MSRIKRNWIFIFASTIIIGGVYLNYKTTIYEYICLTEKNAPGCYLLYLEYKDTEKSKALRFLETSCELKYEFACTESKKQRKLKATRN